MNPPLASPADTVDGWNIDPKFLEEVQVAADSSGCGLISWEDIDNVLFIAMQLLESE